MQSGEMQEAKTEENFRLNLDNGRIKYIKAKQTYLLQVQKNKSTRDEKMDPGAIYVCPMSPRLVWSGFDGTTAPKKLLHNMNIIAGEERLCSTYYLVSLEINRVSYPCLSCAHYGVQLCGVYLGANISINHNHNQHPLSTLYTDSLLLSTGIGYNG